MDLSFGVESYGFSAFDSFMPGNMGINWNIAQGGFGESLLLFDGEKQEFPKASANPKKKNALETKNTAALKTHCEAEFPKDSANPGKKDAMEPKNAAAMKSHCEAERRRRERINAHFATLRSFVPSADKMDKATLLAEVINQVKLLEKQANEATKGLLIPTDTNEVTVEPCNDHDLPDGFFSFKASLSCDYKPELIPDIRRALEAFKLTITKPEISTLGSRVKSVFIITAQNEEIRNGGRERFASSIHDALCSVLEKISSSEELLPGATFLNKRRKLSFLGNSSSSK